MAFVSNKSKGKIPIIKRQPINKKSNRSNRVNNNVKSKDKAVKKKKTRKPKGLKEQ